MSDERKPPGRLVVELLGELKRLEADPDLAPVDRMDWGAVLMNVSPGFLRKLADFREEVADAMAEALREGKVDLEDPYGVALHHLTDWFAGPEEERVTA